MGPKKLLVKTFIFTCHKKRTDPKNGIGVDSFIYLTVIAKENDIAAVMWQTLREIATLSDHVADVAHELQSLPGGRPSVAQI